MKLTLTGTGTSHGVPVIGCRCSVCTSLDARDRRNRCSAYLSEPSCIVIDTGPEFRIQAITYGIDKVDCVLITHSHADHLNGLDDLRIFSHTKSVSPDTVASSSASEPETEGSGLKIYANSNTVRDIRKRFDYIGMPVKEGGGKPKLELVDCSPFNAQNPIECGKVKVVPVPLKHGSLDDSGWLLTCVESGVKKSIAYLTDCNFIPQSSIDMVLSYVGQLDFLVIDGLRKKPHSTHFCFEEALAAAEKLKARHTYLTHLTHNMHHTEVQAFIDGSLEKFPALKAIVASGGSVEAAYDGLVIDF